MDFLRFLWWPEGDLYLAECRMTVHLFGAVSSRSCACFVFRKTAEDNKTNFPTEVAEKLKRNVYMDDLLKSMPSEEDAIIMVRNLIAICQREGFNFKMDQQ